MQFGKKNVIQSKPLNEALIESLYPKDPNRPFADNKYRNQLENIYQISSSLFSKVEKNTACFVFEEAMEAFVSFADEVYSNTHHEATGLIAGYYLHDPNDPQKRIIVGTNFLQAAGKSSTVTCEFSYEDSARHSMFCEENNLLPVIWIHSHPGLGVFYSATDSETLQSFFKCDHQLGIVVDNIKRHYKAFKVITGGQTEISVWGIKQRSRDIFMYTCKPIFDCTNDDKSNHKEIRVADEKLITILQELKEKITVLQDKIESENDETLSTIRYSIKKLDEISKQTYSLIENYQRSYDVVCSQLHSELEKINNSINHFCCHLDNQQDEAKLIVEKNTSTLEELLQSLNKMKESYQAHLVNEKCQDNKIIRGRTIYTVLLSVILAGSLLFNIFLFIRSNSKPERILIQDNDRIENKEDIDSIIEQASMPDSTCKQLHQEDTISQPNQTTL